jgi:hypothetical protein
MFSNELIRQRNALMRPGYARAILQDVWVYRGLPSSEYDPHDNARSLAQRYHWERDRRVHVTLRPLRYRLERDATGRPLRDVNGNVTITEKREKGVDVLCALAMVREAARPDIDLAILASHDSDLEPAIDEAREHAGGRTVLAELADQLRYNDSRTIRSVDDPARVMVFQVVVCTDSRPRNVRQRQRCPNGDGNAARLPDTRTAFPLVLAEAARFELAMGFVSQTRLAGGRHRPY